MQSFALMSTYDVFDARYGAACRRSCVRCHDEHFRCSASDAVSFRALTYRDFGRHDRPTTEIFLIYDFHAAEAIDIGMSADKLNDARSYHDASSR